MIWVTRCMLALCVLVSCGPAPRDGSIDATPGPACVDGTTVCEGSTLQTCVSGQVQEETCGALCDPTLGCITCAPSSMTCQGRDVAVCGADGLSTTVVETCTGTQSCVDGACVDPCEQAASSRSYLGCEYWAVDLDNAVEAPTTPDQLGAQGCARIGAAQQTRQFCNDPDNMVPHPNGYPGNTTSAGLCDPPGNTCPAGYTCTTAPVCVLDAAASPFAVVVANPQAFEVMVTLTNQAGMSHSQAVAAGAVATLKPQMLGFADQSVDGTSKATRAYRVVADAPVVAYQFNPLDNVGVFSNDASLLIPRTTFDDEYYALTWPTLGRRTPAPGNHDYSGYLTVVAWEADTQIEVTPRTPTRAGTGVAAIAAGTPTTFTLGAYEVLNLAAVAPAGQVTGDLTGSLVRSVNGKTFGLFAGTEATGIRHDTPPPGLIFPQGPCCADHIEEMMFPASTWGKVFAVARSQVRLPTVTEPDVVRILAQKAGTTVVIDPAPAMGSCGTLGPGQFCQVEIAQDTVITASEPVLVGQYLKSVIWQDFLGTTAGSGDPSLSLAVPVEQYRTSYAFLAPMQYDAQYLALTAPMGVTVRLDGADVSTQLTSTFGGGAYRAGRLTVAPGAHKVECTGSGCGIVVMGYSDAVSYMFAGGLDLTQIVID